jgi:intein/homing endonuclease
MAKDTLLQTPDKIVAVEQLKKGDRVLTITGDYERITNIIPGKSDYMVSIQPEGEQVVLKLTDGHGIMTNRGLIPAGDLRMDDEILMSDGDYRGLSYLAVDFYGDDVYDIETENNSLLVASGMIVAGKGTLKSQNMVRKNKKQPELPKEFLEELKRWCEERNRNR